MTTPADNARADQDDADLLARYAEDRDPAALEPFIERHAPFVLRLARRTMGSAADADDVAQSVFMACLSAADRFRRGSDPRAWLATITLNACRDRMRAEHRRRLAHARSREHAAVTRDEAVDREALSAALMTMPERDRVLIALRFMQRYRMSEIAEIVQQPRKTVESRLRRALARLRARLAPAALAWLAARENAMTADEDDEDHRRRDHDPERAISVQLHRSALADLVERVHRHRPADMPMRGQASLRRQIAAIAALIAVILAISAAAAPRHPRYPWSADAQPWVDARYCEYELNVDARTMTAFGIDPTRDLQLIDDQAAHDLVCRIEGRDDVESNRVWAAERVGPALTVFRGASPSVDGASGGAAEGAEVLRVDPKLFRFPAGTALLISASRPSGNGFLLLRAFPALGNDPSTPHPPLPASDRASDDSAPTLDHSAPTGST